MPPQILDMRVPGVYIAENTLGGAAGNIASHSSAYMIITTPLPSAPKGSGYLVSNLADFTNVFGASPSAKAVELFFLQRPGSGLYVLNVTPRATRTVTVATFAPGTVVSLTLDGFTVAYTCVTGDTATSALAALSAKVNSDVPHLANLSGGLLRLRNAAIVVTASASVTLGAVVPAPTYPSPADVLAELDVCIDSNYPQGFLLAPEFFQTYTSASDLSALANGMAGFCADQQQFWVAMTDCSLAASQSLTGGGAVNLAKAERSLLNSPNGHLAYYFPYWEMADTAKTRVPASPGVVGAILRAYRSRGLRTALAGVNLPVYGIGKTSFPIDDAVQAQLDPLGINCIRLKLNAGYLVYGDNTLSTNNLYKALGVRVTMNVLNRSVFNALDSLVFEPVDGQGQVFTRIKNACVSVCDRLYSAGLLYGKSAQDAYRVICDDSNNDGADLDAGIVYVTVEAKPSPRAKFIGVLVYRAALTEDLTAVDAAKLSVNEGTLNG